MKKAYSVAVIVLTLLLSVITLGLIRKTEKFKKRQYKTDEKKVKSVEDNEIPTEDTIITKKINTVAIEDGALVGSMDKNEGINAKQDQHIMTKSQIINTAALIAAPVATLITAVIAFFALKESMLQRENMYRPELYIGETKYLADISDMSKIKYFPMVKDSIIWDKQVHVPYLKINNIGMGTALHVDGTTIFRWELSNPLLAKLKMPSTKRATQSYEDVYMHGNDSIILSAATEHIRWKTDYIMPIAQIGEEYLEDLFAPNFGTVINVSFWLMKITDSPVMYFSFPIELSYKDINDQCYLRKRDVLIKCSKSSKNKDEFFITICSGQAHREFHDEMMKMMRPEE